MCCVPVSLFSPNMYLDGDGLREPVVVGPIGRPALDAEIVAGLGARIAVVRVVRGARLRRSGRDCTRRKGKGKAFRTVLTTVRIRGGGRHRCGAPP